MPYELLSRSLAYISCLSTLSLAMTSVAFAAVNIGKMKPSQLEANAACSSLICQVRYEPAPITGSMSASYITSGRWSGTCETAKL